MSSRSSSNICRYFQKRFVLTPAGTAVLIIALAILIRSLFFRNAYEIILFSAVLLLLLVTGIIGAWKSAKLKNIEPGWKTHVPYFAEQTAGEDSLVTGLNVSVPLFFRLHFIVSGKFFLEGSAVSCSVFAETSVSRGEKTAQLHLDFPMAGFFQGEGCCRLRDIFGFFSFPCGEAAQQKKIKVRSVPYLGKKNYLKAQSGAEDKHTKTSTNEERYYMREYSPGDRLRDINWKSSEKFDILVTRISPDNNEKINRLEIYFRNYGNAGAASLEDLWLLDRAKAQLSHFLQSLNEEASYVFCVHAAQGSWEIPSARLAGSSSLKANSSGKQETDLETFLDELAYLPFAAPKNETAISAAANKGELYVFSTACDTGLNGFIAACSPRPVSIFFVQKAAQVKSAVHKKEDVDIKAETEILLKRNFVFKNCFISPLKFFERNKDKHGVSAGTAAAFPTGRKEIIYAEIKL